MDVFRKGFFTGLGLGMLAKDEVEKNFSEVFGAARDTAKEGMDEARRQGEDMANQIAEQISKMEMRGEGEVQDVLSKAGLATTAEVQELRTRVEALEKALEEIQGKGGQ
ncbi:phasin family protein [Desulfohalovibrio reitneri]|jgi:polyhydroxyalkanoate synthesis regulator phasin|uniref:phasin family protein n=1 Tax=Desulfohalovibrio reitneri TaxID=1307759 RepID=UPI0004A6B00A|nr:phasin family protein [Desulfohalovibrio reitneri]